MIRIAFAAAWANLWDWPFFRALVAFDAIVSAVTAGLIFYCYFAGKIGLIK